MNVSARAEGLPVPVSAAASYRLAACLGLLFGTIIASGQEATIQKIVMTGDAVPGLEEDFAFFRGVHLFEDGEVGFAGITTRTGSFFQNAPRGIYLSNTSGALSVIAEIDDADAFRSFGLPDTIMDSSADKTFAFDYFNSTDTGNFPVLGRKVLGEDREAFNPDDGSFMLVSHANLPDTTFFQGNFLTIWGGIMLNAPGDVLADATFEFEDGDVAPLRGLFVAIETNDVRNIVFENDPAPIAEDAPFTTIRKACLADNGNVFFSSILGGANVPNGTRETLWMENQGVFQLLLREGHDAPGLPGKIISLTGLNMHVADMRGENLVVLAGARQPGGSLRRVVWLGDTSGNNLTPIIHHFSSPVLEDDDYFTATDQGPIAFTNVDGNAVLLDDSGNVYFVASGKFEGGTDISGIWKYAVAEGINQLLVQTNPSFRNFRLLGANNLGAVAFLAENQDVDEVWTRNPAGDLARLISSGETVESRAIIGFADHSTVSGLFNESNKTLGLPKKFRQLNDSGDLVFVARFSDTENDDDTRADEAILLASTTPPQTERYLWNGEAGDDDWHKVMNWEDLEVRTPATRTPGDQERSEEVVIAEASVSIDERPADVGSLSANGSLLVNQALTLEEESMIENLTLNADLSSAGNLTLNGRENRWTGGAVLGSGRVELDSAASLEMDPAGPLTLGSTLVVHGEVDHNETHLILDGVGSKVSIKETGFYKIAGGSVTDNAEGIHFENSGVIIKNGTGKATIDAFFENLPNGILSIENGELEFTDPSNWSGSALVKSGGVLSFGQSPVLFGTPNGDGFLATGSNATNAGTIRFSGSEALISAGDSAVFDLSGSGSGGVEAVDGARFYGSGTLVNKGSFSVLDGLIESKVVNEGTLTLQGESGNIEANVENDSDFVLHGAGTLGTIGQKGQWVLENNTGGKLIKRGEGNYDVYFDTLSLGGDLRVESGSLTFFDRILFGSLSDPEVSSSVTLGAGAELALEGDVLFLSDRTTIVGEDASSVFKINSLGVKMNQFAKISLLAETHWMRGPIEQGLGGTFDLPNIDVGGAEASVVFRMEHPDPAGSLLLGSAGSLLDGVAPLIMRVTSTSEAIQNSDITLAGVILVDGIYRLNDSDIAGKSIGTAIRIQTFGELVASGASTVGDTTGELSPVTIDVDLFGTVKVLENGTLNVFDLTAENEPVGGSLNDGSWTIESNARLNLVDTDIHEIGSFARVHLHQNSELANLPSIAGSFTNSGRLTLEGTRFSTSSEFRNKGRLTFTGGSVAAGTIFENTGTVSGSGTIEGFIVNTGTISPGASPGTLTVEGDYTQDALGSLDLELGGEVAGIDYDQLVVNGTATLAGNLMISCIEGVFPEAGSVFVPIVAEDFVGEFDSVRIDVPSSRQNFTIATNGTEFTAQAVVLDVSDFSAWRDAIFTAAELADESISGPDADPDGDRLPNLIEYVMDGNPKAFTSSPVEHSFDPGGSNVLVMDFPWANGVADYTYALQYSADLVGWEDLEHTVIESVDEGIVTRISISASVPDGKAGFARLLIVPM